jgi:hypothetical protein
MNQPISFPYGQLRSLSFRELYSLVLLMARRNWVLRREHSLILRRTSESDRMRLFQPAYAAVFRQDSGNAAPNQRESRKHRTGTGDNAR